MQFKLWMEARTIKDFFGKPIAPPRTFYRGTDEGGKPSIIGDPTWDSLTFASHEPRIASYYGKHVRPLHAKPGAKILYEGTKEFIQITKGMPRRGTLKDFAIYVVQKAKAAGYDAVWFKHQEMIGTAIINLKAFDDPQRPSWEGKN
jgi:hypothetical protein